MESAFSTLGFVIFGLWISIYAIVVESHRVHVVLESSSSALLPSSSGRSAPRPSPISPSPSKKQPSRSAPRRSPPKKQPQRPPPPPPPPRPRPRPRPRPSRSHHSPDPAPHSNDRKTKGQSHQRNTGKLLGLLFLGMAGIMQIGVVGFLVFKRRQLLKTKDRYESGS